MSTTATDSIVRATGLLVIEVINSNPNGDPVRESDPRQRPDGKGEISPVSFKRKVRDLIENKDGDVWKQVGSSLVAESFAILESRDRGFKEATSEEAWEKVLDTIEKQQMRTRYWDARVFGCTFLENEDVGGGKAKKDRKYIRTGVVHFGLGLSVAPIDIARHTNTKLAGAEKGLDRGMAPMGYRFVPHGVYVMPFFVNPSAAHKSGCTKQDIDLMLTVIPFAYPHTRSHARPMVEVRHAWYIEHKNALGSCSDFALISALTPTKNGDKEKPSTCWEDYEHPTFASESFTKLASKVGAHRDLMDLP